MGRSITEGLYLSPLTRNGSREQVSEDGLKDLDDDAVLYSPRGAAPEGWYNAGTEKHYGKGTGYVDHQIFKKLPTSEAPSEDKPAPTPEPKEEEPKNEGFTDPKKAEYSPQMQQARERVQAFESSQGQNDAQPYATRGLMQRIQNYAS